MSEIKITRAAQLKPKYEDATKLAFGHTFTDHMFTMVYEAGKGWHDLQICPYGNFPLDPSTMAFHYGQAIFEGLKAYRAADGGTLLFRPRDNFARMNRSADRLCIAPIDTDQVMEALKMLLELDNAWIPDAPGTSLYIRPFAMATDPFLGVKASSRYLFSIILSPVGPYYAEGFSPVKIYVEDQLVRANPGGTGEAKCAGNYAASLLAGEQAKKKGYTQVLWLDGVHRRYVEEVGSMNIFFKIDGTIITPALNGSILPGITRDSILRLARDMGYPVEERAIDIHEVFDAAKNGVLEEVFGTGTAAVVSPVGELNWAGNIITVNNNESGPAAVKLYETLTGIQYGRLPDPYGWVVKL
jgi:branched-chain amino acid aminotransferase